MEDAKKNTDHPRIIGMPENAGALTILRAVIAQKRADAGKVSQRIDAMEEEAMQARCVLEAQYTHIDDLERDADRLEAANNGVVSCGG